MHDRDNASHPPFLDLLDTDPQQAAGQFYAWVCGILAAAPPTEFRRLTADSRPGVIHDLVIHCIRDDFRVLRRYTDHGKPLAAWFYVVARNKLRDMAEAEARLPKTRSDVNDVGESIYESTPEQKPAAADERLHLREILGVVGTCIRRLDQHCQLLLRLAGDEFRPREIVRILRWSPDRAPNVSEDLRQCRARLCKLLTEQGMTVSAGEWEYQ